MIRPANDAPGDEPPGDEPPGDEPPGDEPPGDGPQGHESWWDDGPPGDEPPEGSPPAAQWARTRLSLPSGRWFDSTPVRAKNHNF